MGLRNCCCLIALGLVCVGHAQEQPVKLSAKALEGTWELLEFHLEGQVIRPPDAGGTFSLHDGVVLFVAYAKTKTGHVSQHSGGRYKVDGASIELSFARHLLLTKSEDKVDVRGAEPLPKVHVRPYSARADGRKLVFDHKDHGFSMILDGDVLTYLEDGKPVRRWKRVARSSEKAPGNLIKTTVTYREVDGHKILADVYRSEGTETKPVIVWFHGGALINWHREAIGKQLLDLKQILDLAKDRDYAVVSFDYRLAPETKLPEIISDVEAAIHWLTNDGARRFHLDPKRLVVAGESAGGYLALVTGYRAKPRPKAIVSFWGYGELTGEWQTRPSEHALHNWRAISDKEAAAQTDGTVISDSRKRKGDGRIIQLFNRQQGVWPQKVTGFDPKTEARKIAPYEPVHNVDESYPPTLMIHGIADTDVPHDQSVQMAEQFKKHDVPYKLIGVDNGEHGLRGADADEIADAYRQARSFMIRHLEDAR